MAYKTRQPIIIMQGGRDNTPLLLVGLGLLFLFVAFAFPYIASDLGIGEPIYTLSVHSTLTYNPYILPTDPSPRWTFSDYSFYARKGNVFDSLNVGGLSIGTTGELKVRATLSGNGITPRFVEGGGFTFSQIQVSQRGTTLEFKGLKAGSYTVKWEVFEDNVLRGTGSQNVVVE